MLINIYEFAVIMVVSAFWWDLTKLASSKVYHLLDGILLHKFSPSYSKVLLAFVVSLFFGVSWFVSVPFILRCIDLALVVLSGW